MYIRGMKNILAIAAISILIPGCFGFDAVKRTDDEFKLSMKAWQEEHGRPATLEESKKLYDDAKSKVDAEIVQLKADLIKQGVGTAARFASGDIIGGIFSLLGLAGAGVAAYRKKAVA